MEENNKPLTPGEVLEKFPALKREKLNYWAKQQYVPTITEIRRNRKYISFPREALSIIQRAYDLIVVGKMKDIEAFDMIRKNLQN